jgi:hypothetical protein
MKISILCFIAALAIFGCTNNSASDNDSTAGHTDSTMFFQTSVIIKRDINELDSTPYFIYKIDQVNDKKDSTSINTNSFKELASRFLKPDITSKELKPYYRESIFEDKTIGGFTITYRAVDEEQEVRSVDILLKEDGRTVKNIFIRKFFNYGDSSAIEQLIWKPQERFQIIRSVQKKDNSENNHQTLVVWNQKS